MKFNKENETLPNSEVKNDTLLKWSQKDKKLGIGMGVAAVFTLIYCLVYKINPLKLVKKSVCETQK